MQKEKRKRDMEMSQLEKKKDFDQEFPEPRLNNDLKNITHTHTIVLNINTPSSSVV